MSKKYNKERNWDYIDDATKYGEFISSYFAWLSLDRQKQNAKNMENMTNPENSKK